MTRFLNDPARSSQDDDPGTEGNSRLTASTGILLTALLLIEGFTILDVHGYLTLHTVIGLMLIGPLALKCATTIYRMVRYYTGRASYVRRGAPPLVLRLIGPFVVLSSLAVVGTGVALLSDHDGSDTWLTLHQASFVVWVALTTVHFLGHIVGAARDTARDLRGGSTSADRQRRLRLLAVASSLAVGIAVAAAFTPSASSWHEHRFDEHGKFHHTGG